MNRFERACRAVLYCGLAASTAACATVTRGTQQAWSVETVPPGASVKTTIGYACDATPCTFKMARKSTFEVTITKEGYKPYHGNVVHQISGGGGAGFVGNALIGGVIGGGVDIATGAMMDLKPNPLKVTLEAVAASPPPVAAADGPATPAPAATAAPPTAAPAAPVGGAMSPTKAN
jgi:hypothetical protein